MQVCLISVYTTMSLVLWSPLVRLFVGLRREPSGNAEGKHRDPCVHPAWDCYQRRTSVPLCLDFGLTRKLSVSDASWFTASGPRGSRIGWRCCPVCQPRGLEFSPGVYNFSINFKFMSLSGGLGSRVLYWQQHFCKRYLGYLKKIKTTKMQMLLLNFLHFCFFSHLLKVKRKLFYLSQRRKMSCLWQRDVLTAHR